MAEYYKYVARDADSQINYAELGQQAVGELQNWYNTREEKKEAYKQASRESINNLMDAPQGKDQNANDFISNYAQDMINQKMSDKNLFERGLISEKEYTLRMQNQMDGTKRLFNLQKLYQQEFETTMQGINDKTLQSGLTIFNQSSVEGAANFNNSKAFINPEDGSVSVGLMENKVIDGKLVRVLNKNTAATTAVWTGKIMQKPAYFDVDTQTTDFVKNLGEIKDAAYRSASTTRAGSITEYIGYEFIKNLKDPVDREIAQNFSDAINYRAEGYLSNKLNVTSILTDDTGKYNAKSFTFDREEADADPKKILVTIDPTTQMTTMDETGKNYKAQYDEAKDFIKNKILTKMDAERKISTTGQLQDQDAEWKRNAREKDKEADTATNMIGKLWYGNNNEVGSAIDYFKGMKNDKGEILFTNISRDKTGVNVTLANGSNEHIDFLDKNGKPRTQEDFIASAGPLLAGQLDVSKSLQKGAYNKKARFNMGSEGEGTTITPQAKYQGYLETKVPLNIDSMPEEQAARILNSLATDFGLRVETGGKIGENIKVIVPGPDGKSIDEQVFDLETGDPESVNKAIIGYMTANANQDFIQKNLQNYKPVKVNTSQNKIKEVKKRIGGY